MPTVTGNSCLEGDSRPNPLYRFSEWEDPSRLSSRAENPCVSRLSDPREAKEEGSLTSDEGTVGCSPFSVLLLLIPKPPENGNRSGRDEQAANPQERGKKGTRPRGGGARPNLPPGRAVSPSTPISRDIHQGPWRGPAPSFRPFFRGTSAELFRRRSRLPEYGVNNQY